MAKFELRLKARKLRKQGYSIRAIAKKLSVSKSSVSAWCSDLRLSEKQKKLLIDNARKISSAALFKFGESRRRKKIEMIHFYQEQGKKLNNLSRREFLIAGLALYWAEGSNKDNKLSVVNSDPAMLVFMQKWFKDVFGVKKEAFMPRIFINDMHRPRIKKVLNFWSSLLELPIEQFGNPTFLKIKQKKVYENYDSYYGVLALRISKGRELKYKILGLIDALKIL